MGKPKNEKKKQKKLEKKKKQRAKAKERAKELAARQRAHLEWPSQEAITHMRSSSRKNVTFAVTYEGLAKKLVGRTISISTTSSLEELHNTILEAFDIEPHEDYWFSTEFGSFTYASKNIVDDDDDPEFSSYEYASAVPISTLTDYELEHLSYQLIVDGMRAQCFELFSIERKNEESHLEKPEITRIVGHLDLTSLQKEWMDRQNRMSQKDGEETCQCICCANQHEKPANPYFSANPTKERTNFEDDFLEEQPIDYLFAPGEKDKDEIEYLLEIFTNNVENGHFLLWEAELCRQQNLTLTTIQRERLKKTLYRLNKDKELEQLSAETSIEAANTMEDKEAYFETDEYKRPCPQKPWYKYAQRLLEELLVEKLHINSPPFCYQKGGFFMDAIKHSAFGLSLPEGATHPMDIAHEDKWSQLELQDSLSPLLNAIVILELDGNTTDSSKRIKTFIEMTFEMLRNAPLIQDKDWITVSKIIDLVEMPKSIEEQFIEVAKEKYNMQTGDETIGQLLAGNK